MYRKEQITPRVRRKLFNDDAVGVPIPKIHSSLAKEVSGFENLAITERDLRNELAKEKKLKLKNGDVTTMLSYFQKMSKSNNMFFHMERYDEFERLQAVIWVDARSRVAYEEFGDVVCFDATYVTNEYNLPFANFAAVNHHGQSILLGCALVSKEDTATYEWVFSMWLECMGRIAPTGILTDQCLAMRKALKNAMPQSRHRWCIWHILKKIPEKFRGYEKYDAIKESLLAAVYDSLTQDEFEARWESMINTYKLEQNECLAGLYADSHMWVPCHMKHMFWAGMKTTQRCESINSFFDGYVTKHTNLSEFAEQYFRAMEARVNAENEADAYGCRNIQGLVTDFPMEQTFQKVYTYAKFKEFQIECVKVLYVNISERKCLSHELIEHLIQDRIWIHCKSSRKHIPTRQTREYVVTLNIRTNEAWCVCKHFECHGILCHHVLRVYDFHKIEEVPQKYVLRRWRKDVKRKHTLVKVPYHDPSKTEDAKRYDRAMVAFESLCLQASDSDEKIELVLDMIQSTSLRLMATTLNVGNSNAADNFGTPSSIANNKRPLDLNAEPPISEQFDDEDAEKVVKDPPLQKKPKHRTTDSRYKSAVEKNVAKCKGKGQGKRKTKGKSGAQNGVGNSGKKNN